MFIKAIGDRGIHMHAIKLIVLHTSSAGIQTYPTFDHLKSVMERNLALILI